MARGAGFFELCEKPDRCDEHPGCHTNKVHRISAAFPPGNSICAYGSNGFAPSPIATHGGFYNGSGPNDVAANGVPLNPYIAHTYVPIGYNMPFEMYFKLDIKI